MIFLPNVVFLDFKSRILTLPILPWVILYKLLYKLYIPKLFIWTFDNRLQFPVLLNIVRTKGMLPRLSNAVHS